MSSWDVIDRRRMLSALALSAAGASMSGWLPAMAQNLATDPRRRRHCILLWMPGGPSQTDTFDMKPGHANGGEFKETATNVPGVRFSEHFPQLAKQADKLAIIRSLSTKEGDHERGSYLMRTGQQPMSVISYPAVAAALSKELAQPSDNLPPYVCVTPGRPTAGSGFGPGFLGPKYAPLVVAGSGGAGGAGGEGFAELKVDALRPPAGVSEMRIERRLALWKTLEEGFISRHASASPRAHRTVYQNALQMVQSTAAAAFDLSQEPEKVRTSYGRGVFGQGCLLARRLIEHGVPFVEVALSTSGNFGWDTHSNNFAAVKELSAELDAGWATLMSDLAERGLLESTTIVWMGEFGRTPQINGQAGRDHFPRAWSCVLGGGGIAGGQVYGRTTADGMYVDEDRVDVTDVLATICAALGVPPETENNSNTGRPIKIVDGLAIERLLA
jgi:hypothetical protein